MLMGIVACSLWHAQCKKLKYHTVWHVKSPSKCILSLPSSLPLSLLPSVVASPSHIYSLYCSIFPPTLHFLKLRQAETMTLEKLRKDKQPGEVESVIYQVLRQRHLREVVQLATQHEREKKLAVEEKKAAVQARRQTEREQIVEEQEKSVLELISSSVSLSGSELAKQKAKLKQQHSKVLAEFDERTQRLADLVPTEVMPEMDIAYNEKVLTLRERQIRELATALQQLSPEEVLIQSYKEEADRASKEAEKYRKEVIEARESMLAKLKEEKRMKEKQLRREREQKLRELEAEVERERQKDLERQEKLKERYEEVNKQRLARQEADHLSALKKLGNIPEEERKVRYGITTM